MSGALSGLSAALRAALSGGVSDLNFISKIGTGANNTVSEIAIQSDGRILLGGSFTNFHNVTANRIVRLYGNGEADIDFMTNVGAGLDNTVSAIAIQSDGKIIIGGAFTTFNGATVNRIVRLNSDGTRDVGFTTNTGSGANNTVSEIAIQSDGKILLSGYFKTFNGVAVKCIIRLNTDGTRDTGFTGTEVAEFSPYDQIYAIKLHADNKICYSVNVLVLVQGPDFNYFSIQNRFFRMNSSGAQDTTFNNNLGSNTSNTGSVLSIAIQSNQGILLGGSFTTFNGATVNRIVRLNSDGTRDVAFTTNTGSGANGNILSIAIQSDGKIVIGGSFTTFNGATVDRIVRLNIDGTRDVGFTTNTGSGANNTVHAVVSQPDANIILSGGFTSFNNSTVNRVARIGGSFA
jgi:uncharacterized delta-60 repeat protein